MNFINKNSTYRFRFLMVLLLALTFLPGGIYVECGLACDGGCRTVRHEMCDVFSDIISPHADCCSNPTGNRAPCCDVQQHSPENGRLFPVTSLRVDSRDFFNAHLTNADDASSLVQTGFNPQPRFFINSAKTIPTYLQNLSILR